MGGGGTGDFAAARLNADGSLDTDFGTSGWQQIVISGLDERATSIAVQADGKIVLGGYAFDENSGGYDFAAARLNADGSLDTDFGSFGHQVIEIAGNSDFAWSIMVQSDGKIVLGGQAYQPGTNNTDFAVVRLNSDGSLDMNFGTNGRQTIDFAGSDDLAYSLALQADGKIVLGGTVNQGSQGGYNFAAARFHVDGSLDASFGTSGWQTIDFAGGGDSAYSVKVQSDGKIVLGGQAFEENNGGHNFAAARLNADGSLDTNFGLGGRQTIDFDGSGDGAYSMALQSDGKIVLGGQAYIGPGNSNFAVVRLLAESFPPTADAGGPYTTLEGTLVVLDAAGSSDPSEPTESLTFEWDLNYDGITFHVDASGLKPSVSFPDNMGPQTIAVRVTNSSGKSAIATTTLIVNNLPPSASIAGPATGVRNQPLAFSLSGTDSSGIDEGAGFTYAIDWSGDGIIDQSVLGSNLLSLEHAFDAKGS